MVLDRNGNGTIDNGLELFGDSTHLPNGTQAKHGFEAIRPLDTNYDNKISATDAQFNELKVWRDLNQDGISQANELQGLAEAGVESINLQADLTPELLANGNTIYGKGSFTRTTGTQDAAQSVALNMNFLSDTFHRQFTTAIPTGSTRAIRWQYSDSVGT